MHRAGRLEIHARRARPGEGPDRHALGCAVITVSDNGQGMSAEILDRVFEPFFTTKPAGSGTGLGLSQVYGFCAQAGGDVEIDGTLHVGTTVSMFLPATAKAAVAPEAPVVLMTGYSSGVGDAAAMGLEVLTKPCPADEIIAALSKAVRRAAGPVH